MKYVSAYLLKVLSGKDKPTAKEVGEIITSAGGDCDNEVCSKLVAAIEGIS